MKKVKNARLTIQRIVEIARQHFTEKGYAQVTLEGIVKEANLTRGAIYHHFKNKEGLFLAVFEEVEKEIAAHVERAALKSADMWEQLLFRCRAFVSAASECRNHRILLIDGPAALGRDTIQRFDQKYSMKSLKEHLQTMKEEGMICSSVSIDALSHCLSGAMNEAALWVAQSEHRQLAINEVSNTLASLLENYRA